ncbi:MAG: cytochrome c4 [Chromatiales bacterium]|nr:cytochrome c4 [Chromatiales bacterium]
MKGRNTILAAIALIVGAGVAQAGPSSQVAWTVETVKLVKSGDPEKGKQLSAMCANCHGAEGVGMAPNMPSLAGQQADYTYKQLADYKTGSRANPIMSSFVAQFSDQDMADIAAYYASMPLPASGQGATGDAAAAKTLVRRGDGKRLIPACAACHAEPDFRNHHGAPKLEGQHASYFVDTMKAYGNGSRANDVYSVMRNIAKVLTDEELKNLAAYYANPGN